MMSERHNNDNPETLFSFELRVEYIRIERGLGKVPHELALGVRLLDFPTLLIYQSRQSCGDTDQEEHSGEDGQVEYAFNRGKTCSFKMNLDSLHNQLSNTPLYAMVLDVKEEIPRLLGTSLIPLARVMDRIMQDATGHGNSAPSAHGERQIVGVCNLTGENIGSISLSYKLLSLGASLLPHITESPIVNRGQRVQESSISAGLSALDCRNVQSPALDKSDVVGIQNDKPSSGNTLTNEDKQDSGIVSQTEHKQRRQEPLKETEIAGEEDLTIFCPPHLFYSNSEEGKCENEGWDCPLLNLDSYAFTFDDTCSEKEADEDNNEGAKYTERMDQRVRRDVKTPRNQETSASSAPNVLLSEALQQLPLLNALLVELSQLNGQSPHQPLSIHPNLAWIYRPASTEPSATAPKAQSKSLQKTRQSTSHHLKHLNSPRNYSTPVVRPASVGVKDKQEKALNESKSCPKSRKKLVYGTTKTFDLRLKQISPLKVKGCECKGLIQNEKQSSTAKGEKKVRSQITTPSKRALYQRSSLNDNIETMMQSVTVDSALRETVTLKHRSICGKQKEGHSGRSSERPSLLESHLECVHIPSVDDEGGNVTQNMDKNERCRHSESNQSRSESHSNRGGIESSGSSSSSRHGSPNSSCSSDSGGGEGDAEEADDYADDFNSLEPSDAAYSPYPASSPEPSRAKTPNKSPFRPSSGSGSGSGSEGFMRRAVVLPVPVKAPSSPQQRSHLIQRPTANATTYSFSSDDGDKDGSASIQTVFSVKDRTQSSSRVERSPRAESLISPTGQRSDSVSSSFEPLEEKELEDELGSLSFRNNYQHISELVANKLPGYTM